MAQPGFLSRAAARVEAIIRAARGSEQSRVASVPSASGWTGGSPQPDAATENLLRSWGVYSGRVAPSAGPMPSRFSTWPADDLTPELIISAQREAVVSGIPLRWVELIDQVYSRDGHYAATTAQRVEDVVKGTWRLTRSGTDDVATATRNFAEEAYRACARWRDGLGWLLYSNLYCYNAVEVEWAEEVITFEGPRGEAITIPAVVPARLHNVHPKHFRFDLYTDDPLFWIGNSYQPLPLGKFIFLDGDGLHPTKVRRGHAWQCVWYSLFRSLSWASWAVHVDRFSLPVPIIKYDGGVAQYDEYKSAWESILNALGSGKGAIVPRDSAEFEIKDPPRGGTTSDPASALSDACDAGQSIRVLGATLTSKIGNVGSFAASTTHAEVKYAKEENDAGRMWERIDEQLTAPLILFNAEAIALALAARGYRVDPYLVARRIPKGKHRVPRETDPMSEAQVAAVYVNQLGLPLSIEGALDRIDWPRATSEKDRITGEPQVVSKGGALVANVEAADGAAVNPDPAAEATAAEKSEGGPEDKKPTEKPEAPAAEKPEAPKLKDGDEAGE